MSWSSGRVDEGAWPNTAAQENKATTTNAMGFLMLKMLIDYFVRRPLRWAAGHQAREIGCRQYTTITYLVFNSLSDWPYACRTRDIPMNFGDIGMQ